MSHAIYNCSQNPLRVLSGGPSYFLRSTHIMADNYWQFYLAFLDIFSTYSHTWTLVCCTVWDWLALVISFKGDLCGPKLLVKFQALFCGCGARAEGLLGDGKGGGRCLNCWLWPGFSGLYADCWTFGENPAGFVDFVDSFFLELILETASFCLTWVLGCATFDLKNYIIKFVILF